MPRSPRNSSRNVVLVCGSRTWANKARVWETLDSYHKLQPITRLVHGANGYDKDGNPTLYNGSPTVRGADMMAHEWAINRGVEVRPYPAKWKWYGKRAGMIRNREMLRLEEPNQVIAFRAAGKSNGTDNMVALAYQDDGVAAIHQVFEGSGYWDYLDYRKRKG